MNCDETRKHWHLFHDSEGDPELHYQINEHLAMCPDCARWFYEQSRLEDAIAEKLRHSEPSKALWDRIHSQCAEKEPVSARSWFFFGTGFVLAASVLIAIGGRLWYWANPDVDIAASRDLAALSVGLHEDLATGREAVKLSSRSHRQVEDYLRSRVSFPVRCPPRDDAGFQVQGGGVCHFDADPVAYVVGQVDGGPVSVFIMPQESLARFPVEQEALRRQKTFNDRQRDLEVLIRQVDQNLVVVVGQNDKHLLGVLDAYGSYHEHHSAPTPRHERPSAMPKAMHRAENRAARALDRYVGQGVSNLLTQGTVKTATEFSKQRPFPGQPTSRTRFC